MSSCSRRNSGRRRAVTAICLPALLLMFTVGCDTNENAFKHTGTLRLSVIDRGLVTQAALESGGFQVAAWTFTVAEVEIGDLGVFDYLPQATCTSVQTAPAVAYALNCKNDMGVVVGQPVGIAVEPDVPQDVSVHLEMTAMEMRRAERPILPPGADYDGDGVVNDADNCVLIPNPSQSDINGDGFGDACSLPDSIGDPTIPDRDDDGVADFTTYDNVPPDNCLWIRNPAVDGSQTDSNGDGIGDVCELVTPVSLASNPLPIVLGPIPVTLAAATQDSASTDFNDTMTLSCTPDLSMCALDESAIELTTP